MSCMVGLSLGSLVLAAALPVYAEDVLADLSAALTDGKPDLYLRYRYEYADDAKPGLKDAHASTLRSALGYNTGLFYGFGLYGQLEDVRVIGNDSFDDGGANGVTDRALIADPEGTEIQQANIRYEGIPQTVLRLGRQEIIHREHLHRFLSNVPWRQNWQSYDAFRVFNRSLPHTTVDYAYLWNANRVFGEDNPLPDRSDFRMDSHALRVEHTQWSFAKIEGYAYLLDFESTVSERFSTATYGARVQGSYEVYPKTSLLYSGEGARQTDYGENPNDIAVNYYLGEIGASYAFGGIWESASVKLSYEVLEGDGGIESFQTPLATPHPFHGWSDRFVVTPGDGLEDLFVSASTIVWGIKLLFEYHDFSSDHDDYDYGTEWDLLLERAFSPHFLVGLKYAAYDADPNITNLLRNSTSGEPFDINKAWAYLVFKY
jgi:hypothetical protein